MLPLNREKWPAPSGVVHFIPYSPHRIREFHASPDATHAFPPTLRNVKCLSPYVRELGQHSTFRCVSAPNHKFHASPDETRPRPSTIQTMNCLSPYVRELGQQFTVFHVSAPYPELNASLDSIQPFIFTPLTPRNVCSLSPYVRELGQLPTFLFISFACMLFVTPNV